jgi:cystine transport system permease protein
MNERLLHIILDSFGKILVPGLTLTLPLTFISFAAAMVIAVIVAMIQVVGVKGLTQVCRFYVWVIRGTPLLVQLYVIFYGLPGLGFVIDPVPSAIIVFSINTGAYVSETMRASIEAVSKGQLEAGYCVGMSYIQTMRRIVLPQAFRIAFPTLSNYLIGLVKDTSLAANITVAEMFMATQRIAARTYEPFVLYCEVGLIYLIFSTVLTKFQTLGEKKMNVY